MCTHVVCECVYCLTQIVVCYLCVRLFTLCDMLLLWASARLVLACKMQFVLCMWARARVCMYCLFCSRYYIYSSHLLLFVQVKMLIVYLHDTWQCVCVCYAFKPVHHIPRTDRQEHTKACNFVYFDTISCMLFPGFSIKNPASFRLCQRKRRVVTRVRR